MHPHSNSHPPARNLVLIRSHHHSSHLRPKISRGPLTLPLLPTQMSPSHTQFSPSQHQNQDLSKQHPQWGFPSLPLLPTSLAAVPRMGHVPLYPRTFAHAVPASSNSLFSLFLFVVPMHSSVSAEMSPPQGSRPCFMLTRVPCTLLQCPALECFLVYCFSPFLDYKLHKRRMFLWLIYRSLRTMSGPQKVLSKDLLNKQVNGK